MYSSETIFLAVYCNYIYSRESIFEVVYCNYMYSSELIVLVAYCYYIHGLHVLWSFTEAAKTEGYFMLQNNRNYSGEMHVHCREDENLKRTELQTFHFQRVKNQDRATLNGNYFQRRHSSSQNKKKRIKTYTILLSIMNICLLESIDDYTSWPNCHATRVYRWPLQLTALPHC